MTLQCERTIKPRWGQVLSKYKAALLVQRFNRARLLDQTFSGLDRLMGQQLRKYSSLICATNQQSISSRSF